MTRHPDPTAVRHRFSRRSALRAGGLGVAAMSLPGPVPAGTPAKPETDATVDVLTALQMSRAWINYGPAAPFDFQAGEHPVPEDQLRAELEALYAFGFRGLVTNAMTYGLELAPRVAREVGFHHVIAKLWWPDEETFALEKVNLAREIDHVDAMVVGNETVNKAILRAEPGDSAFARLAVEIEQMQVAHGKPVTTGLHREDFLRYPAIATDLGDFTFANMQPWWVLLRNDPVTAARWVIDAFEVIRTAPGMPEGRVVVAQEASYPSGAVVPESAPGATPDNQRVFFEHLIASGMPFVYGFSMDQWYAQAWSPPGGYGGLWDTSGEPKPVVAILDLGSYPMAPTTG